jgi:ubiquinone/menaquinone biosynthesis C-methylase UbiE
MENLFFTVFDGLPRLGPGDNASTRKAFYSLPAFSQQANILDIGCGTGVQTLELARLAPCQVLALDNHEPYLRDLKMRARKIKLDNKISTIVGDMHNLPFSEAEFDLIWSEGSIYIIGFEKGLREWRKFLIPGGYLAVSELIWLDPEPPAKALEFWKNEYPAMKSDHVCKDIIDTSGFELIRDFLLPREAWWDQYYEPLSRRVQKLKKEFTDSDPIMGLLNYVQKEIDIYNEFNSHFGYVFYVMKRSD